MPLLRRKSDRGQQAENAAAQWLQQQGLSLLQRNYRCRQGEIDLIMQDNDDLVFVEVRWRKHHSHGGALASVDYHKQKRLILAARHFLGSTRHTIIAPAALMFWAWNRTITILSVINGYKMPSTANKL